MGVEQESLGSASAHPSERLQFGKKETSSTTLSFSQVTEYITCPGCFFQRKREHVRVPLTKQMVFGQVLHDLAGLVFRLNKKTEIRFRNIGALKRYVDESYLLQLKGEYPELSGDHPYRTIRQPDMRLFEQIERYPGILEDENFWQYLAYYIEVAQNSHQLLVAREMEFIFPIVGGEGKINLQGKIDQVRRVIVGRTPQRRKFGDWVICELKDRIALRPEVNLPYGTLALQLAIEGLGLQERIRQRRLAGLVKKPPRLETKDRIVAIQKAIVETREGEIFFLDESPPQVAMEVMESDLPQKEPPSPKLWAYDFSTGNYWELTSYDKSPLESALLAVALAMVRFRGYNQNHKHTFPPPVAKPYLPGLEPNREFYNVAMEALNKFRDSCVWTPIKTGAADRVLMRQLARSV